MGRWIDPPVGGMECPGDRSIISGHKHAPLPARGLGLHDSGAWLDSALALPRSVGNRALRAYPLLLHYNLFCGVAWLFLDSFAYTGVVSVPLSSDRIRE